MIGGQLYLTTSRPNIFFSVCVCTRYQSKPKESYINVVKRIMKYVIGTTKFSIWLTRDTNTNVIGYSNADRAECVNDRKNTGGCFFIGNNLIAWHNKK